jgi:hypothetical protein
VFVRLRPLEPLSSTFLLKYRTGPSLFVKDHLEASLVLEHHPQSADWITLLGFFSEIEATNMVKSQGVPLTPEAEAKLSGEIRLAIEYVSSLKGRRGLTPKIQRIAGGDFAERQPKLEADPTFQEHIMGITHHSFAMVEMEKLHAFQPNLNREYILRLKKKAPDPHDIPGLLRFCLPLRSETPKLAALANANPSTNTFTLVSENLDLRIVGQVTGEDPSTGRTFVGFQFGGGLPQMSVVEYKGIYMVKNGYHRAYALLEKGHKYLPCILLNAENYNATGAAGPGFFNVDLMTSDKSPLLTDFSSSAAVIHPRPLLRKILTIHGEVQVIPV